MTTFKQGDRVTHRNRPEWGAGTVTLAEPATHNGAACQRLTIRFDRAGAKVLSTGLAPLEAFAGSKFDGGLDAGVESNSSRQTTGNGALASAGLSGLPRTTVNADLEPDPLLSLKPTASEKREMLLKVPDDATDPFVTPRKRLERTLALFRFSAHGGSLLDWAAMQTQLKDPLSAFNRHELEDAFKWFQNRLEQHLRTVLREVRKADPGAIEELSKTAVPAARQALIRANNER
jgi:hypothetical protein